MLRISTAVAVLLLSSSAVMAQPAPAALPPKAAAVSLTFSEQVDRIAAGRPVPLVVVLDIPLSGGRQPALDLQGKPFVTALQDLCATFSQRPPAADAPRDEQTRWEESQYTINYIPYRFGDAWTVARDRSSVLTFDAKPMAPLPAMASYRVMDLLIKSLTDEQLKKAGASGLRWADFSETQQAILHDIAGRETDVFQTNKDHVGIRHRDVPLPLPLEKGVFRLVLTFPRLVLATGRDERTGRDGTLSMASVAPEGRLAVFQHYSEDAPSGFSFSIAHLDKPRHEKASDLNWNAPALRVPIGVSGIIHLTALVEAAAKATRLSLKVAPPFRDRDVYVGDARMPCADVLRIAAFGVEGAWRKVGPSYLLAWDRQGVAAARRALWEAMGPLEQATRKLEQDVRRPDWDAAAARLLRSDLAWMPGPTPEQMAMLTQPGRPGEDLIRRRLPWTALGLDQQQALLDATAGQRIYSGPLVDRVIDEEILKDASPWDIGCDLIMDAPGLGRLKFGETSLNVETVAYKALLSQVQSVPAIPEPEMSVPSLARFPARAVAPPPLSPGAWERLFQQMKRKGLNTLYVPVLWDGYALIPTKSFPLSPLAGGKDMLADVLKAAAPYHLRVYAVVHALAWHFPDTDNTHWLDKRPDLLDVDVMGRTRRAWRLAHPDVDLDESVRPDCRDLVRYDRLLLSDYVRPDAPEVKARLLGLITDLKRYKGLSGMALAHASRLSGRGYNFTYSSQSVEAAPPLGYTMEARAAFLEKTGADPADIADLSPRFWIDGYNDSTQDQTLTEQWNKARFAADAGLTNDLLARMEASWPGHVHIFEHQRGLSEGKIPAADVAVRENDPNEGEKAVYRLVAPAFRLENGETGAPARIDAFVRLLARAAEARDGANPITAVAAGSKAPVSGVVLDFTATPDLLWDALARLPNAGS